jgi:predicted nucleotidyltransferase
VKLTSKEKQILDRLVKVFREQFCAREIVLYGSAARDELDEGSDIDLLIVLPEVNWEIEKEIIQVCFSAELECGRVFSAVCYGVDELERGPLRQSPLILNARREGITL